MSETHQLAPPLLLLIVFLFSSYILLKQWKKSKAQKSIQSPKLPPGPKRLPLIGNLHQVAGSLPHHSLSNLARIHGPIMHLQLGEIVAIVISSPHAAREILKSHELSFAQRPRIAALDVMSYENSSFIFSPYGEYWRQMRKVCVLELLSTKRVTSFRSIREQEGWNFIRSIYLSSGRPINLSKILLKLINDVTSRAAFGERCKRGDEFISFLKEVTMIGAGFELPDLFPSLWFLRYVSSRHKPAWQRLHRKIDVILDDIIQDHKAKLKMSSGNNAGDENDTAREDLVDVLLRLQESSELKVFVTMDVIKNLVMELFSAGTDTSSTTIEWAMSEMLRNPRVMEKAQAEIRTALKGKTKIQESDIQALEYLKLVVKETLRLHPPGPLMSREAREKCEVNGYEIPYKAKVIINTWAIGRDPESWADPESFNPERFQESPLDFRGGSFEYIPFGSGRRVCAGINFGIANIELPLAQLLYHFDWKCPDGVNPQELDMTETYGITSRRKNNLVLIPKPHVPFSEEDLGI